jgi:FtsZ-binding cell division protein ZapB
MIAILVVVAMAAGAIGVASRQSELNDLRDKNTALAHDNAALRTSSAVLAHDKATLRDENAGLQEKFDVFGLPHGDVPVSETSFRIAMPTRLHAGHHTIALTNNGEGHELLLFRTDLSAAALPVDTNGDVTEDSPMLHKVLDSGGSPESNQSLPVTLDPGHYVAICNVPGHYLSGMRLDITVNQ